MNYKFLIPTFRNRYLFVRQSLATFVGAGADGEALNLGTGEGDYDRMIAAHSSQLVACDINEEDVAFARQLNAGVPNLRYCVADALALDFPDGHFDLLVSVEVIEHVGQPARMMQEVARVLKPGGLAIITFPSLDFPITYDPINRILATISGKKISEGAYAFGHEYLISPRAFRQWAADNGLAIRHEQNMSGYLIGLLEMYWTGWVQRLFKANSTNLPDQKAKKTALRPTMQEPALVGLTDTLIQLDFALFKGRRHSVGKGFVLQKK